MIWLAKSDIPRQWWLDHRRDRRCHRRHRKYRQEGFPPIQILCIIYLFSIIFWFLRFFRLLFPFFWRKISLVILARNYSKWPVRRCVRRRRRRRRFKIAPTVHRCFEQAADRTTPFCGVNLIFAGCFLRYYEVRLLGGAKYHTGWRMDFVFYMEKAFLPQNLIV